jgi:hypothetical protein
MEEIMSKYDKIKNLSEPEFRRLTGVKVKTFNEMVQIIREKKSKHKKPGRPHILCIEDRILMSLEYMREYRTYFHISQSYGLSESVCYRTCKSIENALIKSGKFPLPGRKALLKSDIEYEVVLVDASESPIERPKKK